MSRIATAESRIEQIQDPGHPPAGGDSLVAPRTVEDGLDELTQAVQRACLIANNEEQALLAERDSEDGYDPSQSILPQEMTLRQKRSLMRLC